jgi:hypothetical protein
MLAAETAVRAWVNGNRDLVPPHDAVDPDGWPISRGAYLRSQRSPADGAYVVLATTGATEAPVAEPAPALMVSRLLFRCYAGTEESAEQAAAALAKAVETLTGRPVRCGDTDTWIRGHDQLTGPLFVPAGPDSGEQFCFQVSCQLLLVNVPAP